MNDADVLFWMAMFVGLAVGAGGIGWLVAEWLRRKR